MICWIANLQVRTLKNVFLQYVANFAGDLWPRVAFSSEEETSAVKLSSLCNCLSWTVWKHMKETISSSSVMIYHMMCSCLDSLMEFLHMLSSFCLPNCISHRHVHKWGRCATISHCHFQGMTPTSKLLWYPGDLIWRRTIVLQKSDPKMLQLSVKQEHHC